MSLMEDASRQLRPHTEHLSATIGFHGHAILEALRELKRESDLGRPDTGDIFKFIIVRREVALGATSIPINLISSVPSDDIAGPALGEIWTVQSICVNGQPNKSPGFAIRTNTGRLLFAVVPEGMGSETPGGDIILLQGETIIFEPLASGTFDFTLSVLTRKMPRQLPDAGHGISQEHYETHVRTSEHERERDFSGHSYVPAAYDQKEEFGGQISPDPLISGEPSDTAAST